MDGVVPSKSESADDPSADPGQEPPRFEFRVWGEPATAAARRLRSGSSPAEVRTSAETYFVSTATVEVNVKARVDLFDVKTLIAVEEGCEQWAVHLKAPFPMATSLLAVELFEALRIDPPAMNRQAYSLGALVAELVEPHPNVAAVAVTKQREMHSAGGCIAEVTEVSFVGRTYATLAVESADLDAVTDLRNALGLRTHRNQSYPAMIRAALGGRFEVE